MTPTNLQEKKLLPHIAAATTIATMATTRVPCLEEPEPSQMQSNKLFVICLGNTKKEQVSTSPSTGPIQEGVLRYSQLAS